MMRISYIAAWLQSAQGMTSEQLFTELLKTFPNLTHEEYSEAVDLTHRDRDRRVNDNHPG